MQGPPRAISRNCSIGSKVTRPSAMISLRKKPSAKVRPRFSHMSPAIRSRSERHVGEGQGQIVQRAPVAVEAGAMRRHAMPDSREAASSGRAEIAAWISRNPAYSSR